MVEWLSKFGYDMIHMTEGEKLINYWYVWVVVVAVAAIHGIYKYRW